MTTAVMALAWALFLGARDPAALPWGLAWGALVVVVMAATELSSPARRVADGALAAFTRIPAAIALAGLGIALILIPLSAYHSPVAYLAATPERAYDLFKQVMLWLPLGFLFAVVGGAQAARQVGIAGAVGFLFVVWPYTEVLTTRELVGVAAIPLAVWWGSWLGLRVGEGIPSPSSAATEERVGNNGIPRPARASKAVTSPPWPAALLARRLAAVAIVATTLAFALDFPRAALPLAAGLALYGAVLTRWPLLWLAVVPACLPLLDLATWTGRFYLDEFDLVLMVTAAGGLWHGVHPDARGGFPRLFKPLLTAFVAVYAIGLARGLWPLAPLDENAFSSYWSHWNALRVAKGLGWALVVAALVRWTLPRSNDATGLRLLLVGSWAGLLGLVASALLERAQYARLLDLEATYRITGTFSSMHTGGNHIEAYLVTSLPLLWLWIVGARSPLIKAAGVLAALVVGAATVMTLARGGILALGVGLVILAVGAWRAFRQPSETLRRRRAALAWLGAFVVATVTVVILGSTSGALRDRFAQVGPDLQTRITHWQRALDMLPRDAATWLFGHGLGRFPESYLLYAASGQGGGVPATYAIGKEEGNRFLRMAEGETVYLVQRVPARPDTDYTLSLRLRSESPSARFDAPLCEKHLLHSSECAWITFRIPLDGQWHERSQRFNSGDVGRWSVFGSQPADLQLLVREPEALVEVDDIRLTAPDGENLVINGDFEAGTDAWFPRSHTHLPFHIKNMAVSLRFQLGWLGLASFVLLVASVLVPLVRASWAGSHVATTLLASLGAFLITGLFGSPFDAPRLALLFFSLVFVSALFVGRQRETKTPDGMSEPPGEVQGP